MSSSSIGSDVPGAGHEQPSFINSLFNMACTKDNSYGPDAESQCRGGFDFTFGFGENTLLILPMVTFLLAAPIRVFVLVGRKKRVVANYFGSLKLTATMLYAISCLVLMVLWSASREYRGSTAHAAAALMVVESLAVATLSRLENSRSIRPSSVLQYYLLISLFFEAVRVRTLWLGHATKIIPGIFTASMILKAAVLLLESKDKQAWLLPNARYNRSPEDTIGMFRRNLFWWLNALFREGYWKVLSIDDLFAMDSDLTSEKLHARFQHNWDAYVSKRRHRGLSSNALCFVLISTLKWDILLGVVPRLFLIAATFGQSMLVKQMIRFVNAAQQGPDADSGYSLVGAFALVYSFIAVCTSRYWQMNVRYITKARSLLVTAIYRKTVELNCNGDLETLGTTTLLSNDVEKVTIGFAFLNELWANMLNVSVAWYLLYRQLGMSFAAPIVTTTLITTGCIYLGMRLKSKQQSWCNGTQARVNLVSAVVRQIKGIKVLGLNKKVYDLISRFRVAEGELNKRFRDMLLWILVGSNFQYEAAALGTYGTFAVLSLHSGATLDAERVFTSLAVLKLLTSPLVAAVQYIPMVISSIACLSRIQKYLEAESKTDYRLDYESPREGFPADIQLRLSAPEADQSGTVDVDGSTLETADEVITVAHGEFGNSTRTAPILYDINLTVRSARLVIVAGKVGAGKSTLLRSLLGETYRSRGSVKVACKEAAYCSQTPWLRNQTIRLNIIGPAAYDPSWYTTVVSACALLEDFNGLEPLRDESVAGTQGIALSGGQKRRIALARALYSRQSLILLDDPLSGLDNHTERHVFSEVFGLGGLLRTMGQTVMLTTHAVHFLPYADHIIVLNEGRILEQGSFEHLSCRQGGYVHSLDVQTPVSVSPSATSSTPDQEREFFARPAASQGPAKGEAVEGSARTRGELDVYRYYLSTIGLCHTLIFFALPVIRVVAICFENVWLKWWSEGNLDSRPGTTRYYVVVYASLCVVSFVMLTTWTWHIMNIFMPRTGYHLHKRQLRALMGASMAFFSTTDIGEITNRFSQDFAFIDSQLPNNFQTTVYLTLEIVGQIGIVAAATPFILAAVPFLFVVFYTIQRVYLRTSRQLRLMEIESQAPLCTHFLETLSGLATIRAFGWTTEYARINAEHLSRAQKPFYTLYTIQNWLKLVLDLVVAALAVLVVGLAIALRKTLDPGFLGLALVGVMDLSGLFTTLVANWTQLETSLGAIIRLRAFAKTTPQEERSGSKSAVPPNWPMYGRIELADVSAKYGDAETDPVLRNVSLTIAAGEKIGICGRSGSGKSTLISLLFGLYEPASGSITIDGVDILSISRSDLRSALIGLPQDPLFVPGTVRSNLALARDNASDHAMKQVLEEVGLWDKIDCGRSERGGLDTELGEDLLSHGERQLFCLARAMLSGGKILIMDEATSSVDRHTDEKMQKIIRSHFGRHTIVAVAHRLNTILDFDRIIVLDSGMIVECGKPLDLLEQESSVFKCLYETQSISDYGSE